MVAPQTIHQIVEVRHKEVERGIFVETSIGAHVIHREIDADDPAGVANGIELPVSEVPRRWANRVRTGMRCHEWRTAQIGHVPETALVEVRYVDHDAKAVAGSRRSHQPSSRPRKSANGTMTCVRYADRSCRRRYHASTLGTEGRSMSRLK
jgi:hypothetical protein